MRLMPLLIVLLLAGCGFHLRGAVELPPDKRVVALQGIGLDHPFARDLAMFLALVEGRLTGDPSQAGSVVVIHGIDQRRRVVSLDEHGKAIEFELIYKVRFEARTADGKPLLPLQTITLRRIYLNTQLQAIGKAEEESLIREEMRREAARTLLRRLQRALEHAD
ncbi:LPS-assembly lipoprotein [Methylomarinovum tepidoasis]|uniref:LPS-assembly lipoprotein LptE n=1 Tax=Methylomarinovum tepidoasis TaxID=2840183 RepID=A0AAU9C6B5_9GAMM|nr:LPS assembly lipoprotein LptE [Methylomarinovum sp. IN45]BCX87930.1 LPS-assembly lipoprotein [Methylomarinovum sp. IN45]